MTTPSPSQGSSYLAENQQLLSPVLLGSRGPLGYTNDFPPADSLGDSLHINDSEEVQFSVSTAFHQDAHSGHGESDLLLCSTDGILFYVHRSAVREASEDALSHMLSYSVTGNSTSMIPIPEPAAILNIILHTIYNLSCAQFNHSSEDLIEAVDKMPSFGIAPKALITPDSPLHTLLLSLAPLRPMDIFALAGKHDLADLAKPCSAHLLGYPLGTLPDEISERIGPVYLKRLFILHMTRMDELKKILQRTPGLHPWTPECGFDGQRQLSTAWSMVATFLILDLDPSKHIFLLVLNYLQSVQCLPADQFIFSISIAHPSSAFS
ncbi:hypothetical protein D9611_006275 [Ephemerocybe angulata]|uniref:BTB domain-containing protein n=1 Tax=Ephemerocybe angulata TaxID=980116 RepID=A0A8H5C6L7_9AGAR|nr:hypothetical protein D9611_006275 [Tulosesus angulatus]